MAHGSPSCWLWMLSLFKVWLLYRAFFQIPSDSGYLFILLFLFLLFIFFHYIILTLDYIEHVVKANFLQEKKEKMLKKEIYGKYIQIVLCNKGNMQIFFFWINKISLMLNCWEYGMLY